MTSLTKKSSTAVVLLIVVALASLVLLAQLNGRAGSPAGANRPGLSISTSSTQQESRSSSSSRTSTSSTLQESTASSSSRTVLPIFLTIGQEYKALFVTPSVTMNYSIKLSQLDTTASPVNLSLSASSRILGVTLAVSPKELTFAGTQELVTLGISLAPTVNSSVLPIEIIASSPDGVTNATFDFSLNKSFIVVLPLGGLAPPTLHVSVGQTVTWLNFMGSTGGGDPVFANVALADGSGASPTLGLNDLWSHTFDKPGTYSYKVTFFDGPPTASGTVIVE